MTTPETEKHVLLNTQNELLTKLNKLNLSAFADELCQQFELPHLYENLDLTERLHRCVNRQIEYADHARVNALYKKSRMNRRYYLSQFQPDPGKGLDSSMILKLKELNYLESGTNILICGPTGTGKTALSIACGMEAIIHGHTVMFYRMSDLSILLTTKDELSFLRFRDSLKRCKLLIIDDYGLEKLPDQTVLRMHEIAEARYGRGSTIISTQLKKTAVKIPMDKSPVRDALSDRLFRPTDIEINLSGDSWRGNASELRGE